MASKREAWLSLLPSDPRPALLASEAPFARFVAMTAVLGKAEADAEVRRTRKAVVADASVRAFVDRLPGWESGFTFSGHNSPGFPPIILRLLHGMGVRRGDFPTIERMLDQMPRHQADDGRFLSALLDAYVADAKKQRMKGVAMVTSEKVWLAGRRVLDKHGFECVYTAPPGFSLMVRKLGKHPSPSFTGGWSDKAKACGKGLTVIRSAQCPCIVDAANTAVAAAAKAGIKSRIVVLRSREDVMRPSPSASGVFGLVLDGKLLSYHYQLEKDLLPLLQGGVL